MKNFTLALLSIALMAATLPSAHAQRVEITIAGTGVPGFSGDNGPARAAASAGIKDVCLDAAGNIYFTDQVNNRIRKISAQAGIITTIAGGGSGTADGIPATSASFVPNHACVTTAGDMYVTTGNEIKKIHLSTGIITTIAGSAIAGYSGDGGAATAALLNSPVGICADAAGNIYIADRLNSRVRKITAATGIITTLVGNTAAAYTGDGGPATAASLYDPATVDIDASGNIYVSDQEPGYSTTFSYSVIRKITAATGIITTVAGDVTGGTGTDGVPLLNGTLGTITGMHCGHDGNVYCTEMSCSCHRLNFTTGMLDLIAGNFDSETYTDDTNAVHSDMNYPMGMTMDALGNIFIADSANMRVRKIAVVDHTPNFIFGKGQYIANAIATGMPVDSLLWITDLDSAQTETWTIVTPPAHGTIGGLPATAPSLGIAKATRPTAITYTPLASYVDNDKFSVRVSDGALYDTITIYIGAKSLVTPTPSSVTNIGNTATINLFPNPATSTININWDNVPLGNDNLAITDISGRQVYAAPLPANAQSGSTQVDIASMPPGVYFVKIGSTEIRKFVKD